MPIKVKKNKKVIKQKQKQSQRQVVNIKIGEIKKAAAKRRAAVKRPAQPIVQAKLPLVQQSVQPVQYMYQSTGSAPIPQSFSNIGVAQPPRANILGGQPLSAEVQRAIEKTNRAVKSAEKQLEIGSSALARENILGLKPEDIRRQRELTLSQPEEASLYGDFPAPSETSVRYSGIFGSASSFEGDNPMAAGGGFGGGSAVSSVTDIPTRTPRFYKNRQTLIREILRATSDFSAEELKSMDTMRIREIYDRFYK